jgi:hypothetical protein
MGIKAGVASAALVVAVGSIQAAEWSGFAGLDVRLFAESPAFSQQNTSVADPSVFLQPEFRHEWNSGLDRFTAIPFGRYDSLDTNRSHWDIREFNWLHKGSNWSLQTGVGKVFWGVTESHHLIDIVNQTDFVENINSEEKLGQPMVNLNIPTDYGNFNLIYLPYFRERTFPAANGRIRFQLPVDSDHPDLNGISHWHPDWAVRWSRTFGDWDLGLSYFNGVGREPRLAVQFPGGNSINPLGSPTLIPTYDIINQTGLDLQGALGNWLIKLEAMTRGGQGDRFAAAVAGFEYTHYGVLSTSADLGLLMEYQYDGRKQSLSLNPSVPPTAANNDIFIGSRLALNDVQNSQVLVGATLDLDTQATVLSVEASRRLGDNWKIELESRLFNNIPNSDILAGYRQDDYVQLRLIRYLSDLNPSTEIKDTLLASSVRKIQAQQQNKNPLPDTAHSLASTAPMLADNNSTEEAEVMERLKTWAKSWSAGNAIDYLSYYQANFTPDYKTSHNTWKTIRMSRVKPNKAITVSLSDITTHVDKATHQITTVFKQHYLSNSYSDLTFKEITWQKVNADWVITAEKSLDTMPVRPEPMIAKRPMPHAAEEQDHRIVERLMSWAQAWSNGNVDDYLNYYQTDFQPDEAKTHHEWVALRKQRVTTGKSISVRLSNINTHINHQANQIITTFKQEYASNNYRDKVQKQIIWESVNGQWRIVREANVRKY